MELNYDFTQRVVVHTDDLEWVDSPQPGVQRRMLARDGGEIARATSIVRYAPGARFSRHRHDMGEEILVLDGDFRDEFGTYVAGDYVKNPAGTAHAPWSESGCTIFVKLRQLDPRDQERVVVRSAAAAWHPGLVEGLAVMSLSSFEACHTALVRWAPVTRFNAHQHYGGEEILVLDGTFEDEFGSYPRGTWIRSPHLSRHSPFSTSGCTIFVKTGHLID